MKKPSVAKQINDLQFRKRKTGWHPQRFKENPVCPECGNTNHDHFTKLRENFFKCDCGHSWDIEWSAFMG